jgi:hypothetical protein
MRRAVATVAMPAFVRGMQQAKGKVEYRLDKYLPTVRGKDSVDAYWRDFDDAKVAAPRSRKEELEHLTYGPAYENSSDFQRAAGDMMAVQANPHAYATDMAYHYHRIWKCNTASRTGGHEGNGAIDVNRISPG